MGLEHLEPSRVSANAVQSLGLNRDVFELASVEGLAASIRRAASFLCPTTPGAVVRVIAETLSGLPGVPLEETKSKVEGLVESLVAYGDLVELPMDDVGGKRRHLFLGPPAYVRRTHGCVLLGVRPDAAPLVSEELLGRVEYRGYVRLIRSEESAPVDDLLAAEGVVELRPEHWLRAPRQSTPRALVDRYVDRLEAVGPAGDIDGLRVIDPARDVTFYQGRWRPPTPRDGRQFVARRPQAFGADLWCFAEVVGGEVTRLIDLPVESPLARGSDEAWRLQAALDVLNGHPQHLRIRRAPHPTKVVLDLFSPVPSWSQRRLDVLATPASRSGGALFSYALPQNEVDEEIQFLESMMWSDVEDVRPSDK